MKSWQVLREAVDKAGAKAVAARLNLSAALVYKWCQEPAKDDPEASGALNPLDRMHTLYDVTRDPRIINWLCNAAGGFFVTNPQALAEDIGEVLLGVTQHVVEDFGQLLGEVSRSVANDGVISAEEADRIRQSWERLKSQAEQFVVACERGFFRGQKSHD